MDSKRRRMTVDQIHQERDQISSAWTQRERARRANIAALRQQWILNLILPVQTDRPRCV